MLVWRCQVECGVQNEITLGLLLLTIGALVGLDIAELTVGDDVRTLMIGLAGAAIYKLRLNRDPS